MIAVITPDQAEEAIKAEMARVASAATEDVLQSFNFKIKQFPVVPRFEIYIASNGKYGYLTPYTKDVACLLAIEAQVRDELAKAGWHCRAYLKTWGYWFWKCIDEDEPTLVFEVEE